MSNSYNEMSTLIPQVQRRIEDYIRFLESVRSLGFQMGAAPESDSWKDVGHTTLFRTAVANGPTAVLYRNKNTDEMLLELRVGDQPFHKYLTPSHDVAYREFCMFTFEYDGWNRPEVIQSSLDAIAQIEAQLA